jgi:hypothetical protein
MDKGLLSSGMSSEKVKKKRGHTVFNSGQGMDVAAEATRNCHV